MEESRMSEESRKSIEEMKEEYRMGRVMGKSNEQISKEIHNRNSKQIIKDGEKWKKQKKDDGKQIKTAFIIVIIFFSIAFFLVYQWKKNSSFKTPEELNEINKLNCAVLAENGIKANLKSPSTAEFNYSSRNYNDYVKLISITDSIFEITGTCDAENSFGAKLREEFTVKIKKENNELKIIDIQIK